MSSGTRMGLAGLLAVAVSACPGPPDGNDGRDVGGARVIHTIAVGAAPHGIRFSQDGDTAYVALSGDDQIAVIDLTRQAVVDRWPAGSTPLDLVAAPGGRWLVTQFQDSTVVVLEGGQEIARVVVGASPSLFAPEGPRGRQYLSSEFADHLSVLDGRSGRVVTRHPTGSRPYPADVTADGSLAFVPSLDDGTVTVIDLLAGVTVAQIDACAGPPGGALTPDGVSYIVACGGSDELMFLNTASFQTTSRLATDVGPRPFSVAVTPDGRYGFANNAGGSTVSVVDPRIPATLGVLDVGEQPIVVRVHPDGRRVFVSNELSGTVSIIETPPAPSGRVGSALTEVVVLGMIHGAHRTSRTYGTDVLRRLIEEIRPDVVLTEIPPNRFDAALAEFERTGTIQEPRVVRFPEYVDVLFPLTRSLDFEIVPTAGWNLTLSDYRAARLAAIPEEPEWAEAWSEYSQATERSREALAAGGAADDPRWIHTDAYDAAQEIRLSVYDRLFNDELGPGGWENINRAHFRHIADALDARSGLGQRVLITYGAGHKGWFLRALRERDDIRLLDVAPFLDAIE